MYERKHVGMQCIVGNFLSFMLREHVNKEPAEAPQEGGEDNEKFDYLSCTLLLTIIQT